MHLASKTWAVALGISVSSAGFAQVAVFHLDQPFSGGTPASHPLATFHNMSAGTVQLVISGLSGSESLSNAYFNFRGNPSGLTFTHVSGQAANGLPLTGSRAFRAGTNGSFDIAFNYATSGIGTFTADETSVYNISGAGVAESLFRVLDSTGNFFAAAQIQGIQGQDLANGWVGAVPEPETYAMLLAGLGLLAFMVNRRRRSVTPAL